LKIIFHIFKKDVRYHWPEILVSLALLSVFAWDQPRRWAGHEAENRLLNFFLNSVPFLLVLTWMFLLVRTVHGEPLVGDRHFWNTRPYERHKLFAAKVLMAVFFVHVPLFIIQIVLLKVALFPVFASVPGLLSVHIMLFASMAMYAFAVASISAGIGQALLVVLLLVLGLIGIGTLFAVFPSVEFTSDFFSTELGLLLIATGSAVTLVQFIFRKTLLSRLLFVGALVGIATLMLLSLSPKIIDGYYLPAPTKEHPLPAKLTFDHEVVFGHEPQQKYYGKSVNLELPFLIDGLADNTVVQIRAIRLDLGLPAAQHWTSGWRSIYEDIEAGRTRTWPSIEVPRSVFDPVRNTFINGHVSLALNVFRVGGGTALAFDEEKLHFADGSRCSINATGSTVKCFSALKGPEGFAIFSDLPNSDCQTSSDETRDPWAPLPASYFDFSQNPTPDMDFSPIHQFEFSFSRRHAYEDLKSSVPVCPSTKFLFASLKFQYVTRAEIDLGDIKLANYLPLFPRKIIPPIKRPSIHGPSGSLSFNFSTPATAARQIRVSP